MGFLLSRAWVVIQLLALLQSSITVLADEIYTNKPVVVQGSVYCKPCKYRRNDTLEGATPLAGVVVRLNCNNRQNPLVEAAKTNKKGYFFFKQPKQLSIDEFMKCKAFLVSSTQGTCETPTDLHAGLSGAPLNINVKAPSSHKQLNFDIFTIKPFAFEPSADEPCNQEETLKPDEVICNTQCVLINYECTC